MTSTTGSSVPSGNAVRRAAVIANERVDGVGEATARVEAAARSAEVELSAGDADGNVDLAIVLGGDGTMLRALQRFRGTATPVIGANFGRVGFLSSIEPEELEPALGRVFAGDYAVYELPTLEAQAGDEHGVAANDVVVHGSTLGRMVELEWSVAGEDLGNQHCDGVVCATPSGSTAYNLSNGGPVLMWGLEAMAVTFVAPHSLHARALVVPRGRDVAIRNRTAGAEVTVLVDGQPLTELGTGGLVTVRLGDERTLLATLPERTFFRRFREHFAP
jgi:NAD+ kinase